MGLTVPQAKPQSIGKKLQESSHICNMPGNDFLSNGLCVSGPSSSRCLI